MRTDDGRNVAFDLKDYDRIDHGYAATIHKAQGMTVDRTHVLATPGLDAHGSYVALSRHRDGTELHYGRDDFATEDRLVNTLSRDRAKDMPSDYEQQIDPAQRYAKRRGIAVNPHVGEIELKAAPNQRRMLFDGRNLPADSANAWGGAGTVAQRAATAARDVALDPDAALREARTRALIRHARAVGVIFNADDAGRKASPAEWNELVEARRGFDKVRPHGWQDAEAAYAKEDDLAREASAGRPNRAIRALQLETQIRTDPQHPADRFVARWHGLKDRGERLYAAGNISGYKDTKSTMGAMLHGLQRDPQLESSWKAASETSASRAAQAAASVANSPCSTALILAEAGDSNGRAVLFNVVSSSRSLSKACRTSTNRLLACVGPLSDCPLVAPIPRQRTFLHCAGLEHDP